MVCRYPLTVDTAGKAAFPKSIQRSRRWNNAACMKTNPAGFAVCRKHRWTEIAGVWEIVVFTPSTPVRSTAHCLQRSFRPRWVSGRRVSEANTSTIINTLQLKGDWNIMKGKMRQKFGQLTEDDLQYAEGKEEELIGRIQNANGQNPRGS